MSFWNQQFSSQDFKYGKQPNSFLREQAFCLRCWMKAAATRGRHS